MNKSPFGDCVTNTGPKWFLYLEVCSYNTLYSKYCCQCHNYKTLSKSEGRSSHYSRKQNNPRLTWKHLVNIESISSLSGSVFLCEFLEFLISSCVRCCSLCWLATSYSVLGTSALPLCQAKPLAHLTELLLGYRQQSHSYSPSSRSLDISFISLV